MINIDDYDIIEKMIDGMIRTANTVNVDIRLFRDGAKMPTRGSDFAAGWDVYAFIDSVTGGDCTNVDDCMPRQITIPAGEMRIIKTGMNVRIPEGFEIQIRPRSGLAFKNQITVMNSPGTIDADYDGDGEKFETNVMIKNTHPTNDFVVNHGDRIAQMVIAKLVQSTLTQVEGDNNNRLVSSRLGGFGSTGVK